MNLLACAKRVLDIAIILRGFRPRVPDQRSRIAILEESCGDLVNSLQQLQAAIDKRDDVVTRPLADDLQLLQDSMAYLMGDIWTILQSMPKQSYSSDYVKAWKTIDTSVVYRHYRVTVIISCYVDFAKDLCRNLDRYVNLCSCSRY